MTQCDRLLAHLLRGNRITPLDSWMHLGIYRLASRISELRLGQFDGKHYPIQRKMVEVKNQYGDTARVAQYWIDTDDITDIMIERKREEDEQEQRRRYQAG